MNDRGQYGRGRFAPFVGSQLQHVVELSQRYDGVHAAGAQALLNGLSADGGSLVSIGTNRWEVALNDGNWVRLVWDPATSVLQVTITDKQPHPIDQARWLKSRFEKILRETIAPRLVTYGAVAVGITIYHSVGDRADAVKQMAIDWSALYASLAPQVGEVADPTAGVTTSAVQKAREEELAAWKIVDSFKPYNAEIDRIAKLLNAAGVSKKITDSWDNVSVPPYADIVAYAAGKAEPLKQQFIAAKAALDKYMPRDQRIAAAKHAQDLTLHRGDVVLQSFDPKKVAWWTSYAKPLFNQWNKFRREQLGDYTHASDYIAFAERFQTNWDVYEDWKKKLDALRAEAVKQGFTVDAPATTALPTTVWADTGAAIERGAGAVASAVGDTWTFVKYGAWAALGIGAIVAISSVASNLKSGKDPGEKYMDLIRQSRRPRAPRAPRAPRTPALPASEQLALASGEE